MGRFTPQEIGLAPVTASNRDGDGQIIRALLRRPTLKRSDEGHARPTAALQAGPPRAAVDRRAT